MLAALLANVSTFLLVAIQHSMHHRQKRCLLVSLLHVTGIVGLSDGCEVHGRQCASASESKQQHENINFISLYDDDDDDDDDGCVCVCVTDGGYSVMVSSTGVVSSFCCVSATESSWLL